ncbi:hypothetical protein FRX31_005668 [Thalictrum thalictroides]|uniref:Uncharacterized protein n=1 Tax=Thalictrum thalictroides TaxID=46969 RepID=A0A7J6X7B1_THATH|nr:hypothetical protein FRX31_005668 [Thalictrum thalictroides]
MPNDNCPYLVVASAVAFGVGALDKLQNGCLLYVFFMCKVPEHLLCFGMFVFLSVSLDLGCLLL